MTKKKTGQKKAPSKKATAKTLLKDLYETSSVYTSYLIRDYAKSKRFYHDILELPINLEIPEAGWYEFMLPVEGAFLGLSQYREEQGEFQTANSLNISVKNIKTVKETLETKGLHTSDIFDLPDMISMITVQDPDENNIHFIGPPRIKSKK